MRVKMNDLPSMTEFLQMHPEIKPETYKRYQQAIKSARQAGQVVAKGLGGTGSIVMEGIDIRLKNLSRVRYKDAYITKLAMGWESRAENAYQVYTDRQNSYLTNILSMMLDEDYLFDSPEVSEFEAFMDTATDSDKARFIKALKGRGVQMLYDPETGEPVIDFSSVIVVIRTEIMGDRRFLSKRANREKIEGIRRSMLKNRFVDTE